MIYVNEDCVPHREDGPAIEYRDGYCAWYIDGKRHRADGPAIISVNGSKYWYILNCSFYEHEFTLKNILKKTNNIQKITSNNEVFSNVG